MFKRIVRLSFRFFFGATQGALFNIVVSSPPKAQPHETFPNRRLQSGEGEENWTKECGWNVSVRRSCEDLPVRVERCAIDLLLTSSQTQESQFKPGIPQYDAVFDPACGFLRRNRPNAAMKLLKKSTSTGKPITHKLRMLNDRATKVGRDVMNNPFKDEMRRPPAAGSLPLTRATRCLTPPPPLHL